VAAVPKVPPHKLKKKQAKIKLKSQISIKDTKKELKE
jgi:hypothetical protein